MSPLVRTETRNSSYGLLYYQASIDLWTRMVIFSMTFMTYFICGRSSRWKKTGLWFDTRQERRFGGVIYLEPERRVYSHSCVPIH